MEDRFCHIPQDVVVPGILKIADLSDIVSSISPRQVLLEGFVSGRNKLVSEENMEKEYGARTSGLVLREKPGEITLAGYLSRQIKTLSD